MNDLLRLVCEQRGHNPKDIDPTGGDPSMGGPVLITVCDRCGDELPHSETAIAFNDMEAYAREVERTSSVLRCRHEVMIRNKVRQVPCPAECSIQSWPRYKFRRTIFGHWKLRKKYS